MTKQSLPPKNKWFVTKARWYSYSADWDRTEHGPCEIIAIRYGDGEDDYSFIHRGQQYMYERLGEFKTWKLLDTKEPK